MEAKPPYGMDLQGHGEGKAGMGLVSLKRYLTEPQIDFEIIRARDPVQDVFPCVSPGSACSSQKA